MSWALPEHDIWSQTPLAQQYEPFLNGTTSLSLSEPKLGGWRFLLVPQLSEIQRSQNLQDDWDRKGSLAPTPDTVIRAKQFLAAFYDTYSRVQLYRAPSIGVSEDGEIVFEWWNGDFKLTVYVTDEHALYIKSWGVNIFDDMEDGVLESFNIPVELWTWLVNG